MTTFFKHFSTVIIKEEDKQDAQKISLYIYFLDVHMLEKNLLCCFPGVLQISLKNGCVSIDAKYRKGKKILGQIKHFMQLEGGSNCISLCTKYIYTY